MSADPAFYRPANAPIARLDPSIDRCPHCKQPLGARVQQLHRGRICIDCNRSMGRHDKFTISKDGLRHRNCEDPESYLP